MIRQYQLIQRSTTTIEVKLFCTASPNEEQKQKLAKTICDTLGHRFTIQFTLLDKPMPMGRSGKFEEFVCLV